MPEEKQCDPKDGVFRLFVVVVLYKLQACDSASFRTLQTAISHIPPGKADIKVLLYDNTPGGQDAGVLPADVEYKADVENGGLAEAYNYALNVAFETGYDWLLTLDQDTVLPDDFLNKLCYVALYSAPLSTVAAIAPCVSGDGKVRSPKTLMKHCALTRRFPDGFIGIPSGETVGVNSATTVRVSAMKAIGGYDPRFRLYCSDSVMYHRLYSNKFRVFVAGNIHIDHELSVFDLKNRCTPGRYEENLFAEEAYFDEYLGRVGNIVILLKLFQRLIYRLWLTGGELPYFIITLRYFGRRLFYSRKHRRKSWEKSVIRETETLCNHIRRS
jgi:GT2 family glycosyltransferase